MITSIQDQFTFEIIPVFDLCIFRMTLLKEDTHLQGWICLRKEIIYSLTYLGYINR